MVATDITVMLLQRYSHPGLKYNPSPLSLLQLAGVVTVQPAAGGELAGVLLRPKAEERWLHNSEESSQCNDLYCPLKAFFSQCRKETNKGLP